MDPKSKLSRKTLDGKLTLLKEKKSISIWIVQQNLFDCKYPCSCYTLNDFFLSYSAGMFVFLCYVISYSRGARVSFGLWILEVKGPTLNLRILNVVIVLITVWGQLFEISGNIMGRH